MVYPTNNKYTVHDVSETKADIQNMPKFMSNALKSKKHKPIQLIQEHGNEHQLGAQGREGGTLWGKGVVVVKIYSINNS